MTARFLLTLTLLSLATTADAQLRPLDPVDFAAFEGSSIQVQAGLALYSDQHASLGGARGTLREFGRFQATVRTGRMVMEMYGVVRRRFTDHEVYAAPFAEVRAAPADGVRVDDGDYRVATALRLTSSESPLLALLRFGTRLPTTDNRVGLERDVTDFFATLAARRRFGIAALSAEAGVSINGTRDPSYEQSDVLAYALGGELNLRRAQAFAMLVGQQDFHDWAIRGNEDLSELRAGVRAGGRRWISVSWVHGLTEFSPENGVQISAGTMFGSR